MTVYKLDPFKASVVSWCVAAVRHMSIYPFTLICAATNGCTCSAGRRCCHSRSPHRGPSPAVGRASGSHRPDPEARRGGCLQTHSRWLAKRGRITVSQNESNSYHGNVSLDKKDVLTMSSEELFSFMVQEPSGIMLCTREMSLFSSRFMYRTILVSEW